MASKAKTPSDDALLDAALGGILTAGWNEPAGAAPQVVTSEPENTPKPAPHVDHGVVPSEPEYPPLPVRGEVVEYLEPQLHGGVLKRSKTMDEGDETPELPVSRQVMDIGLLTDLASGRRSAIEVAESAGVSGEQLQSALAVALREVPPEEIAKAMGLQAAEQQLKSGALYGAVLADLIGDMVAGRLKAEVKLDLAKLLARVGRVEPVQDKGAMPGSGFILNINMSAAPEKTIVLEQG